MILGDIAHNSLPKVNSPTAFPRIRDILRVICDMETKLDALMLISEAERLHNRCI